MSSNIDRYKNGLRKLVLEGDKLYMSMQHDCFPERFEKAAGDKFEEIKEALPSFSGAYQPWYSEAIVLIKQLLPDRLGDFSKLYLKPKNRKEITYENYSVEDYLQGLNVTRGWNKEKVVGPDAAIPRFEQQLNILKSVEKRFESSLFDIRQLVQADLFGSELEAAKDLNDKGFSRGAGAVAGVVLEAHLKQVLDNHKIKIRKKDPTINDLDQLLKDNQIIEVSVWRFIQHLSDLRNKCDHKKSQEPTKTEVDELIEGVDKITKTVF
jgi:hypothetical protein